MTATLDGDVTVVTGGRGIGVGTAQAMLEESPRVVIAQRTETELERTAAQLDSCGTVAYKGWITGASSSNSPKVTSTG